MGRTAFEKRFERYHARLFGYAVALSRDRDLAGDLLHDCVVRAMAARDAPLSEPAYRAWLFTILRNLWIDHVRSRQRRADVDDALSQREPAGPVSLENVVVNGVAVREAFGRLSHDHRDVLALVDISGFSYEEAAAILSVPRGTVMSRVSRARQALARLLSENSVVGMPMRRRDQGR